MADHAPPATGPRVRTSERPWATPADAGEWFPTDLGEGRTLWRPPAALKR